MSGSTNHPILTRLVLARYINMAHEGPVIGAWGVDDLPDEWIDAMTAIVTQLPSMQKGRAEVASHFAAWRAQHPTYGMRKH
jgi:hypothetical protein